MRSAARHSSSVRCASRSGPGCSYSTYVRDTRDDAVARGSLTAFASRTRHRIINDGGMLYQFLGDSVVGLFGVPEASPGCLERAVECARALIDIETLSIIAGSLSPRALGLVIEWAALHRAELLTNWERARARQPLQPIRPLE